ncbi:MAG: tyrosine-protein phosphatase [Oscillospiraceae bacterium]|nr:tyrosine-protein phosphatase [Oscillospiraceae bacterium]
MSVRLFASKAKLDSAPQRSPRNSLSSLTAYRSGVLDKLSAEDATVLTNVYCLRRVVDLRSEVECSALPDVHIENVAHISLEMQKAENADNPQKSNVPLATNEFCLPDDVSRFIENYRSYVLPVVAQNAFRSLFELLLESDEGATLFHCFMGKDRTGVTAALLLHALGVPYSVIMDDYTLSNVLVEHVMAGAMEKAKARELQRHPRLLRLKLRLSHKGSGQRRELSL